MNVIRLKVHQSKKNEKLGTIYYSVFYNKKHRQISSKRKILCEEWDEVNERIIDSTKKREHILTDIRDSINRDIERISDIIEIFDNSKSSYTIDDVIRKFRSGEDSIDFLLYMDHEIERLNNDTKFSTARNYRRTKCSFSAFLRSNTISIDEITGHLINEYEQWLKRREITPNTTSFYMRNLRSVYNKAVDSGHVVQQNPFKGVYTGVDKTIKRAVEKKEIKILKRADLSDNKELELCRDLFLFSFYMRGMAFVDIAYLKKDALMGDHIVYRRKKTGRLLNVKVELCALKIIQKYYADNSKSSYMFPLITNGTSEEMKDQYSKALAKHNRELRKLSRRLKISNTLTSYVSRHTWATMAQNKNIPIVIISESLGHDNIATTQIYLSALNQSLIDKANSKVLSGI